MKYRAKLTPKQKDAAFEAVKNRIAKIAKNLSTTRILIWTETGGEGKTSLSASLALEFDFHVITNEPGGAIACSLPEDDCTVLDQNAEFPYVDEGMRVIFDCKGAADVNVGPAAQNADIILIPIKDHSDAHLLRMRQSIDAMTPHNPNIVIVANHCERGKFKRTRERIQAHYPDLPIIEVSETKGFRWVINKGMSLSALVANAGKVLTDNDGKPLLDDNGKPEKLDACCASFGSIRDQILALAEIVSFEANHAAKQVA